MRGWVRFVAVASLGGLGPGCELNPAFDPQGTGGSTGGEQTGTGAEGEPLGDPCPPMPPASGEIVMVGPEQAAELPDIVRSAAADSTIVLLDGVYPISQSLTPEAAGVTVRSASGDPQAVVVDGQLQVDAVVFAQQPGFTLAELTVRGSEQHAIHITGSATAPADGATIYRVHMRDFGAAAIHLNPSYAGFAADDGTIACSTITVDDAWRLQRGDACPQMAGISAQGTWGWHVRDNRIEGLWCTVGLTGGAVRFFESSADTVVERNVVRDCGYGIVLGLAETATPRREYPDVTCTAGYYGHYGGLVRNNMIVATGTGIAASDAGFDSGIGLWQVCDASVFHNTVVSAIGAHSSIEYRFDRTQARVLDNLVTDDIIDRDGAGVPLGGNLQQVDLSNFVDPLGGDVHLVPTAEAIDAGVNLGSDTVTHDIDGDPRDAAPDIGADEVTGGS